MKNLCSKIFIGLICFIIFGTISSYAVNSTNNYNSYYNSSAYENALESTKVVDNTKKVYDYANLLTQDEEKDLYNDIKSFIDKYNMDMVIVTISENNKYSSMAYADDFYDYNGFGIGSSKSGILFLIDMDNRNMWISTTGNAINIYNDERIDNILDYTYKKISVKDYHGCAQEFIKYAEYFAKKGNNGGNTIVTIKGTVILSAGFAIIVTLVFIGIGSAMNRKPRKRKEAHNYISKPLTLSCKEDRFIDRNVSKVYIDTSSSSSGGSSTHIGSSGTSHGGGGRSF